MERQTTNVTYRTIYRQLQTYKNPPDESITYAKSYCRLCRQNNEWMNELEGLGKSIAGIEMVSVTNMLCLLLCTAVLRGCLWAVIMQSQINDAPNLGLILVGVILFML